MRILSVFLLLTALPMLIAPREATCAEPEGRALCIYAPKPEYPLQARAHDLEGSGMFVLHLDQRKGTVQSITVEKSTGFAVLDSAAIDCLKRWRFIKDVDVPMVRVPFTFTTHGIPPGWKIVE